MNFVIYSFLETKAQFQNTFWREKNSFLQNFKQWVLVGFSFPFWNTTKALRFWGLGGHPRTRSNLLSSILPPHHPTMSNVLDIIDRRDERPRVLLLSFWNGTPCISSWCGKSAYIRSSVGVGWFHVKSEWQKNSENSTLW